MESLDFEKETLRVLKPIKKTSGTAKFNNFWIGTLIGITIPPVAIILFHLNFSPKSFSFTDLYNYSRYLGLTASIISLCVIPNLLSFFVFIWTEKYLSARGVVFSTLAYVILVVIIKFLI